ncbi:MAG: AbrB/MazE/SpoVT family DNA-binding domain-containing protein [Patescibacteria group bacterium]
MPETTTVTTKYQVVIPRQVRQRVKIRSGERMSVRAIGDLIVMQPQRKRGRGWADSLLGLGKEVWEGEDTAAYIKSERDTWDR